MHLRKLILFSTVRANILAFRPQGVNKYWAQLVPHIVVHKPLSDLCWVCHQNTTAIKKLANKPDEEKTKVTLLLRNKCYISQNFDSRKLR